MAVLVLAKSHTEVGIERLRISPFDDSRCVGALLCVWGCTGPNDSLCIACLCHVDGRYACVILGCMLMEGMHVSYWGVC